MIHGKRGGGRGGELDGGMGKSKRSWGGGGGEEEKENMEEWERQEGDRSSLQRKLPLTTILLFLSSSH